ncbi:hypothetical protein BDV25DRAFT_150011 [Aspergillus avenaceus]|uniref:Uncharacterized protein n=1 Tax=Aspergillus avenaceus TaxID=36643 RepID=A0A5N6U4I6_ASPAV|nr:hypothetical protein BDV25DRAFT_150011 [Aspergillus avenaceus]
MKLAPLATILLSLSTVNAVYHQHTAMRTTSKQGAKSPALGTDQLTLGADESRCYRCSSPCSDAVCCHGRHPQCCSDGVYCYCCSD